MTFRLPQVEPPPLAAGDGRTEADIKAEREKLKAREVTLSGRIFAGDSGKLPSKLDESEAAGAWQSLVRLHIASEAEDFEGIMRTFHPLVQKQFQQLISDPKGKERFVDFHHKSHPVEVLAFLEVENLRVALTRTKAGKIRWIPFTLVNGDYLVSDIAEARASSGATYLLAHMEMAMVNKAGGIESILAK